jgi:membrane protease YdiL (CAAX protease family)
MASKVIYMFGPAFAVLLLSKTPMRTTFQKYGLTTAGLSWLWFFKTALLVVLLLLGTFAAVLVLGNGAQVPGFGLVQFSKGALAGQMASLAAEYGQPVPTLDFPPASILFLLLLVQAFLAGYSVNLLVSLGEELGWRGFLLKETQELGFWKSNGLIGLIWGIWHWPIIWLGHNFPHYPLKGCVIMTFFCIALSFPLAYVRVKTKSLLGPAAFHGMVNASGGLTLLFITQANELLGSITGIAGILAGGLLMAGIFWWDQPFIKEYKNHKL